MPGTNYMVNTMTEEDLNDGDLNAGSGEEFADLDDSAIAHLEAGGDEPIEEDYGKKVAKRISKEVKKRKIIEDERDLYRENAEKAQRELLTVRKEQAEARKAQLEAETTALQAKTEAAMEAGESAEFTQHNSRFVKASLELQNTERELETMAVEPEPKVPGRTKAAQDWMDNNSWIETDQARAREAARIENELKAEGYNIASADTYAELDRRLSGDADRRVPGTTQAETLAMPGSSIPSTPAAQHGKRLSRGDLQMMEKYGFNSKDPAHRAEWLASKGGA